MKFQVHRIFFAFISIVLLTAGGFVPDLFAQCFLTEGLSEEQQKDLARQMFEDDFTRKPGTLRPVIFKNFEAASPGKI